MTPAGGNNGGREPWSEHRRNVIDGLKRNEVETSKLRDDNADAHEHITEIIRDVEKTMLEELSKLRTDVEVQKSKLDARSSLFGAGSSALVIAAYLLLQWIARSGG